MKRLDFTQFDGATDGPWTSGSDHFPDPGGWSADHDDAGSSGYVAIRQVGNEGGESVVCLVVESDFADDSVPMDTELDANARLIAAAQTLLAELRRMYAVEDGLLEALDPFVRALGMMEALPPMFRADDSSGLRDKLPGAWPTVGDLRRLGKALAERGS